MGATSVHSSCPDWLRVVATAPMTITVDSNSACVYGDATYRALDKNGIDYVIVDISSDAIALDYVKSLGHMQAPVVVAVEEHWSGYRPDRIRSLNQASASVA